MNKEDMELFLKISALGNDAVDKAIQENIDLGLPNVSASASSTSNNLFYELPDGTVTMEDPLEKSKKI